MVVVVLSVAALFACAVFYRGLLRRKWNQRLAAGDNSLIAGTKWNGHAGRGTFSGEGIDFRSTREGHSLALLADDVSSVELAPADALIRFTRATVRLTDGSTIQLAVTAPIDRVRKALTAS